jgi:hypothetical protein
MKDIIKRQLVEGKYVHKHEIENIFVANLRRALPTRISKEQWEKEILSVDPNSNISMQDRVTLQEYYILHHLEERPIPDSDISNNSNDEEYYVLHNVPHILEKETIDGHEQAFSDKQILELRKFYSFNEKMEQYVLTNTVREMDEIRILNILKRKDIYMSDEEKFRLANIFEKTSFLLKENIFYANMVVDPNHKFFFEHSNEHVPGMMVMEAARQFGIACWHIFGKVPLRGIQFILSTLNAEFFDYVDLNYPIGLKGELLEVEQNNKSGEWLSMIFKTTVFQRGEICALMEMKGRVISKKLFNRLRDGRDDTNPKHRFYPFKGFNFPICLWDMEKQCYYKAILWDLSYGGFYLELNDDVGDKIKGKVCEFMVIFDDVGFIRGECILRWQKNEEGKYFGGFEIVKMMKEDIKNLKEAIKRYCQVRTEREKI